MNMCTGAPHDPNLCIGLFVDMACCAQAVEAVSNDVFWAQLQALCSLLAPFAEAVALVQSRAATLADIAIHLLQLVNILHAAQTVAVLPAGKPRNYLLLGFMCECTALAGPCTLPAV